MFLACCTRPFRSTPTRRRGSTGSLQAESHQPIRAGVLRSAQDVCTAGPLQTYDDGVFVGHIQTFSACAGTASSIVRVSANPADQAFTADLLIQLTGEADDAATLNGLLLSFNRG